MTPTMEAGFSKRGGSMSWKKIREGWENGSGALVTRTLTVLALPFSVFMLLQIYNDIQISKDNLEELQRSMIVMENNLDSVRDRVGRQGSRIDRLDDRVLNIERNWYRRIEDDDGR